MEVITAVGLAGSIVGVTDVIARSLRGLLAIQTAYKSAPLQLTLIVGQLTTVKAALKGIKRWVSGSHTQYTELYGEIHRAVECCELTVLALDERIESMNRGDDASKKIRARFVLEEKGIKTFSDHLDNQVHALNLLITVAKCESNDMRSVMLRDREMIQAFRQIEDDSSSYIPLSRGVSRRTSFMTSASTNLDTILSIDSEIMLSHIYRQALKSVLKKTKEQQPIHEPNNQRSAGPDANTAEIRTEPSPIASDQPADHRLEEIDQDMANEATNSELMAAEVPIIAGESRSILFKLPEEMVAASPAVANLQQKGALATTSENARPFLTPKPLGTIDEEQHGSTDLSSGPLVAPNQTTGRRRSRNPISTLLAWRKQRESIQSGIYVQTEVEMRSIDKEGTESLERERTNLPPKVLILGCGEAGKSTLVRSMRDRYDASYHMWTENFKPLIFNSLIEGMQSILRRIENFDSFFEGSYVNMRIARIIFSYSINEEKEDISRSICSAIIFLWRDQNFRRFARSKRDEVCWEAIQYYCTNIGRIAAIDYVPTLNDIVHCREPTLGVHNYNLSIGSRNDEPKDFHIIDVGGYRSSRQHWPHHYQNVSSVVFVIDIGSYDQVFHEGYIANRIGKSLLVFDSLVNSSRFVNTDFILCFTKVDKLKQKRPWGNFGTYFTDIPQDQLTVGGIKAYLARKFVLIDECTKRNFGIVFGSFLEGRDPSYMVGKALNHLYPRFGGNSVQYYVKDGTEPEGSVDAVTTWKNILERTQYMTATGGRHDGNGTASSIEMNPSASKE